MASLSEKLERIDSSLERIRVKTSTQDSVIEDVAQAVEDIPVPEGTKEISVNGTYDVTAFANASVNVPGIIPQGTKNISLNGIYDITNYASANVEVGFQTHWDRPSDWWDTKTILSEAENIVKDGVTYYPAYIMLLADWDASTTVEKNTTTDRKTGGDAFIFSDEPTKLYVGNQTHTWDTTKDKECSEGYKTRYIIVYVINNWDSSLKIELRDFKVIECIFGSFYAAEYRFGHNTAPNKYLVNFETLDTFRGYNLSAGPFYCCPSLKHVNFPTITTFTAQSAFANCTSLISVEFPKMSSWKREYYAFNGCKSLKSLILPSLTSIDGSEDLKSCVALVNLDLPNVTSISDQHLIASCNSLTILNLPKLTSVSGNYPFGGCNSLTTVSLPKVRTLSKYAFGDCVSLESIDLPIISTLDTDTFSKCVSLTKITLPNTITSISKQQFTGCVNLRQIVLPNNWNFELIVTDCDMTRSSLLDIINKLKDLTGLSSKTFTFGANNLAKLTNEEIAIATNKNWILN